MRTASAVREPVKMTENKVGAVRAGHSLVFATSPSGTGLVPACPSDGSRALKR